MCLQEEGTRMDGSTHCSLVVILSNVLQLTMANEISVSLSLSPRLCLFR